MTTIQQLRKSKGFTVLELMTVIAVFSISVSIATPSYKFLLVKYQLKGAVETIVNNLQTARSEAIKLNSDTFVVFNVGSSWKMRSSNTLACATNSSGCVSGDWESQTTEDEFTDTVIDATTLSSDTIRFDYIRGTSNIGAITISMNDYSLDIKVNKLGYLKVCANNDLTSSNTGYEPC